MSRLDAGTAAESRGARVEQERAQRSGPGRAGGRTLGRLVALMVALMTLGCGSSDAPPATFMPVLTLPTAEEIYRLSREAELKNLARTQVQRGYTCGWHSEWMEALSTAREVRPAQFRSQAMGKAFGWGLITLALGFGGVFVMAWLLPRLRRRPKKPAAEAKTQVSWSAYFKDLAVRVLHRLGRALRVEQFDPLLASERQRAIENCRDTERQLSVTLDRLASLAQERPERAAAVAQNVETWRSESMLLRRRLEGPGSLGRELAPDRVGPRIEVMVRAARDLRLRVERLATLQQLGGMAADTPAAVDTRWAGIEHELAQRPETPRDRHAVLAAELPSWVRLTGWGGLGALALSLPMMAAWTAAGAFPLFFALLFAIGGLGAVTVARIYLHRAGRLPLLPGFADRVARWLTGLASIVFVVVVGSSWLSRESGLDLGDPPPVALDDPRVTEAPLLWKDVELYPQRSRLVPPPPSNVAPEAPPETPDAEP